MPIGIRQRGGAVVDTGRRSGAKRPLWMPGLKEKDLTEGMDEESLEIAAEADSPEQQRLDAAGIRTPTYERPSFFTNLLTGGAAGRQADDANTQSLRYKNDLLARQAEISEQQRQENERLDKTHGWNTEAATTAHERAAQLRDKEAEIARKQLGYGVVTKAGLIPDDANMTKYNTTTREAATAAALAGFGASDAESTLKERKATLEDMALQGEGGGKFIGSLHAGYDLPGLTNRSHELSNRFAEQTEADRIAQSHAAADHAPDEWAMKKATFDRLMRQPLAVFGPESQAAWATDPGDNFWTTTDREYPMAPDLLTGKPMPVKGAKPTIVRETLAPGEDPRYKRSRATDGRTRIPGINQ